MRRVWNRLFDLTGFRCKTLWDWMGLLIVPLFIAGATLVFSVFELRREEQRVHTQQQIETDRAQQTILQSYMQDMTELLLDKRLATSKQDQPVGSIARSSTLTAVRQLDADRKGILLQFLYESNLITVGNTIISLNGADLSGAILTSANLSEADLSGAILSRAGLRRADLIDAKNCTNEQLAQALSLVGATLPNGTVIKTEEDWEEFKKQYRQSSQAEEVPQ